MRVRINGYSLVVVSVDAVYRRRCFHRHIITQEFLAISCGNSQTLVNVVGQTHGWKKVLTATQIGGKRYCTAVCFQLYHCIRFRN